MERVSKKYVQKKKKNPNMHLISKTYLKELLLLAWSAQLSPLYANKHHQCIHLTVANFILLLF